MLRRIDQGKAVDRETLERSLRLVDRQIDRLTHLVTDLLETVRLEAGTLELDCKDTDLVEMVQSLVYQIQLQAARHQIVVRSPDALHASVDPLRFEQVVLNLLDNAVKFSPDGGEIDIELNDLPARRVRLTVRDHGLGVPLRHRAHLFERFYQAHGKEHRSGMGLGLYITHEIVERHRGSITAEFPDDGGTRFVVEIPAASREARAQDSI